MKRRDAAIIALAIASGFSASAWGQIAPASKGPMDITADEAEVVNSSCSSTWRGAAEVLQGDTRLRANVIRAFARPRPKGANGEASCGPTDRVEADGDVFYVTPTQSARGDHAVYSADADQIVLTGNVIVVQGKDVTTGDRLTIKVSAHEATMDSAVKGEGKPGRVRGVFYPDQPGGLSLPTIGH